MGMRAFRKITKGLREALSIARGNAESARLHIKRPWSAAARRGQCRSNINKTVDVVRPAMQQNDRSAIGRTGFGIADIEDAGIDLLERREGSVRSRLNRWQTR